MSGRAGRRGIDENGIAILMIDERIESSEAKAMLKGDSDPLNSAFHLKYHLLLNAMKFDESFPEFIIKRSFFKLNDRTNPLSLPLIEYLSLKFIVYWYFMIFINYSEMIFDSIFFIQINRYHILINYFFVLIIFNI